MKIAPAGKKNENGLPFSMRGVLYAPKIPRGGNSSHVRPAIPTGSMRTCQSLWDKGGGLPVGNRIVISFYNKVAQDWKQDGSYIQMRLPDPHSAVTSQQQLDRVTGTVQRRMEVDLEPTEIWLALCELDIECYDIVSSYNPSYIAQALQRLMIQPKMKRKIKGMMRKMLGRMRERT